ncbi:c-type cytochrome [Sulfurovum sp.]|jgi:cytochrome c553|uniref:c-type cytochrome n=1 Tax=Sulfurovum sp. TaxID=1969726 RepID=UPI002A36CADA|nr:c-type cytochrome [Sulfurovum sp.]MDD2451377.1 c-type cytochrome [Sulfurovum sp.]MDD3499249.1 c-type cytochrome [Sulfurovum sp.]MDY0402462.1 c-type cytochrome [Sulfurovum sp.]
MKRLFLLPIIILSLSAAELSKEEKNEMRQLYLQNACNSCHGNYGEGMGASPRLQGLNEEVLLKRLKNLQEGKTRTAFGTIMISFAKSLTPEQTRLMAKYLADLETKIPEERYEIEFTREGDGGS